MNEIKRLLVVLITTFLSVILIVVVASKGTKSQEDLYNEFKAAFNGETNMLVYIGRPTCGYCNLLTPSLEEMKERYDFDYIYLNTDEINSNYINKIMEDLNLSKIGTPYLAVVSNGKIVDTQNGYADYDSMFEFLQINKIIDEDAELLLNYIDYKTYDKLLKSKERSVIVVGQSTCSYCIKAKIILNEVVDETKATINYLNLSYLTQEEGQKFETSLDYFEGSWGTPVMLVVENGKLIDSIDELASKTEYIEFLIENKIIKGE